LFIVAVSWSEDGAWMERGWSKDVARMKRIESGGLAWCFEK
jgi:hypothetical protein